MAEPSLYLATPCFGGVAQARYMRSLLALRIACAARNIPLQLDLGGGEALVSRARAGMLARFLAADATHLLFADSEAAFEPDDVFALLAADAELAPATAEPPPLLLIRRDAAERMVEAYADLSAKLGDVRNAGAERAVMLFEAVIDRQTARYVADLDAFCVRWRDDRANGPTLGIRL
jgi:hypothetical protein